MKRNIDESTVLHIQITQSDSLAYKVPDNDENSNYKPLPKSEICPTLMEKEELNEKHLKDALKFKREIPIPGVELIESVAYNKLYPDKFKPPKYRIFDHFNDNNSVVDYDADTEDEEWIGKQEKSSTIKVDTFEKCLEFLENNCNKQVPLFSELEASFRDRMPSLALELIYDYWLNKRIKNDGVKLMLSIKKENRKGGKKKYDPYVAFRQCPEKMRLRKNREKDYESYVEMLLWRKRIESKVKLYKSRFVCEQAKHELLKKRFKAINEQYKKKKFDCVNFEQETTVDIENLISNITKSNSKLAGNTQEQVPKMQEKPLQISEPDDKFPFNRKPECQFYAPRDDFPTNIPDINGYFSTTSGMIRMRIGRGGRLLHDRIHVDPNPPRVYNLSPEFMPVRFRSEVILRKCDRKSFCEGSAGASEFKLFNPSACVSCDSIEMSEI